MTNDIRTGEVFEIEPQWSDGWHWPVPMWLLAAIAVAVLCRPWPVRVGAIGYGLGALVIYLVPGPIGSNVERLALLFTGLVLLASSPDTNPRCT